jgi:hypothetical protein
MKSYLLLGLAASAAFAFATTPARAEVEYPWCSRSSTAQGGGPSCRYASLEQCQNAVAYSNGWCERNARVVWAEQQAARGAAMASSPRRTRR